VSETRGAIGCGWFGKVGDPMAHAASWMPDLDGSHLSTSDTCLSETTLAFTKFTELGDGSAPRASNPRRNLHSERGPLQLLLSTSTQGHIARVNAVGYQLGEYSTPPHQTRSILRVMVMS
jgi:hypothetical protein